MSVIRVKKDIGYFVASNVPFNDKNLSWEARGVMGYLLSKPDGWECRNYDLINQGPAGKHIIQRVLKELKEAGYIHRYQKSDGHKIEWITEIYETPELNTTSRNTEFLQAEEPTGGNSTGRKTGDIVNTDSQKILTTKKTDFNDSAKNSKTETTAIVEAIQSKDAEKKRLNTLATNIAKITKTDIDTAGPKTREGLKALTLALSKKPNNEAKLIAYEKWWYANDWRGKQGQPPSVFHIGDTWGQFEAEKIAPPGDASTGPILSDVAKENYARLMAEQAK